MYILHTLLLGLFLCVAAMVTMRIVKLRYRLIMAALGCSLSMGTMLAHYTWLPDRRVKAIYPCDPTSPDYLKNMHIVMSDIQIPSDTTIVDFDLMTAQCGDTLYAYHLIRQTKHGLLYVDRTRTVITRHPMLQYEGRLTVPWLY